MKLFKTLFHTNRRQNRIANNRCALESFETRQLLAAILSAIGTWNITDTRGNGRIYVARDAAWFSGSLLCLNDQFMFLWV